MFETNYTRFTSSELKTWMDEGRDFLLLDVLSPYAHGHRRLPGAKNACVFEVVFGDLVRAAGAEPGHDRPIVVYGESDDTKDAECAARKLVRRGYSKVYMLADGFQGWRAKGMPVEGSEGDPPDHSPLPPEGAYTVSPEESMIEWTGRNANGRHTGTVALTGGVLRIRGARVDGEFTIDPATLKNTDLADASLAQVLIAHLLSDDFLFVDKHPLVHFAVQQADPLPTATPGAVNCRLQGELTMRGRAEPLAFPATVAPIEGGVAAEAHFDLDRTRWGLLYGSGRFFRHLGMHLVNDAVSIQLRLVCRP